MISNICYLINNDFNNFPYFSLLHCHRHSPSLMLSIQKNKCYETWSLCCWWSQLLEHISAHLTCAPISPLTVSYYNVWIFLLGRVKFVFCNADQPNYIYLAPVFAPYLLATLNYFQSLVIYCCYLFVFVGLYMLFLLHKIFFFPLNLMNVNMSFKIQFRHYSFIVFFCNQVVLPTCTFIPQ